MPPPPELAAIVDHGTLWPRARSGNRATAEPNKYAHQRHRPENGARRGLPRRRPNEDPEHIRTGGCPPRANAPPATMAHCWYQTPSNATTTTDGPATTNTFLANRGNGAHRSNFTTQDGAECSPAMPQPCELGEGNAANMSEYYRDSSDTPSCPNAFRSHFLFAAVDTRVRWGAPQGPPPLQLTHPQEDCEGCGCKCRGPMKHIGWRVPAKR